ncbi:peptidylprolyl isomerase [Paenibacillaceae bacterium WGS1546]|uniref:peptidylprolyl isomerase n=1 Tax=Cohnella sp. WGS1546 TaxID=3366810 RepID=UPI00372D3AE0
MTDRKENDLPDKEPLMDKDDRQENEELGTEVAAGEAATADGGMSAGPNAEAAAGVADEGTAAGGSVSAPANGDAGTPARAPSSVVAPWLIAVIAVVAFIFVLVRNPSGGGANENVATMDGLTLTKADIYNEMARQFGDEQMIGFIDTVAQNKIVDLESEKAGVSVTDADIQQELEAVMKLYNFDTEDELSMALMQSGATLDDFKEQQILPNLKVKLLFKHQNPASEDDLKAYFEQYKESTFATTPKEVEASHILVYTQEEADEALKQLKEGKDFAELAGEISEDPGSKDSGGELGFFGPGVMNSRFETAAFALAKGEMSEVVEADNGYHIIKVTDVKEAVVPEYDEVKDDVVNAYYDEKMGTEAMTWLDTLKEARSYENLMKNAPAPSPSASPSPSAAAE